MTNKESVLGQKAGVRPSVVVPGGGYGGSKVANGLISLEVYGHLGTRPGDPGKLYQAGLLGPLQVWLRRRPSLARVTGADMSKDRPAARAALDRPPVSPPPAFHPADPGQSSPTTVRSSPRAAAISAALE
jgi:hypothetical protein